MKIHPIPCPIFLYPSENRINVSRAKTITDIEVEMSIFSRMFSLKMHFPTMDAQRADRIQMITPIQDIAFSATMFFDINMAPPKERNIKTVMNTITQIITDIIFLLNAVLDFIINPSLIE